MLDADKFALKSKTILSGLAVIAVAVLPMLGVQVTAEDGAMFSDLADRVIMAIGGALAIYGRFAATENVKL